MNYILLRNFSFNFSVRLFAAPLVGLRGAASRTDKQFRAAFPGGIKQEGRRELGCGGREDVKTLLGRARMNKTGGRFTQKRAEASDRSER